MSKLIPKNIIIVDPVTGKPAAVEQNGALAVNIQDQHTRTADLHFSQAIGGAITLTGDADRDDTDIDVSGAHGIVVGEQIRLFDNTNQNLYSGIVTVVATNNISLDRPLTVDFTTALTAVSRSVIEMDVNGAVTPQIFSIGPVVTAEIDITRIMFLILCSGAPIMASFGDLSILTNGVCMRKTTGNGHINYFSVKNNAELLNLMYDITFYDATHPSAANGIGGRLTYGGQEKHGVVIRLSAGEALEVIIQDDLTSLLQFRMISTGHEVTD